MSFAEDGVQKKQFSLAVNLLYGHFLSLAAVWCCGEELWLANTRARPAGHQRPLQLTPLPPSSSGVSLLLVLVPKPAALPPLITHLSCLMRELAGRPCCITALISI